MKRLFFAAVLILGYGGLNAQIVTPQLDPAIHSKSPAATGWRTSSAISLNMASAEGDVKSENTAGSMEKIGDVKYYGAAEGDGDTALPSILAVFKTETLGLEIYAENGKGVMKDVDVSVTNVFPITVDQNQADKDMRAYFSYQPFESLSLGLGYRQKLFTEEETLSIRTSGTTLSITEVEETETGISLVASLRLAEMFFLAGGMENMSKTGKLSTATASADYVDNSWMNTYLGAGMRVGEPGETQFRAEYSMISSPESDEESEGGDLRNYARARTESYATLEALFGRILVGYENRRVTYQKIETGASCDANVDRTDNVSLLGAGWIGQEGFSVSVYAIDYKRTDEDQSGKTELTPKGWVLNGTYRF